MLLISLITVSLTPIIKSGFSNIFVFLEVSDETGVIDVKFNSKGKKGKQNKRVTLTTNMVPSQQVLIVKGQVNIKEE